MPRRPCLTCGQLADGSYCEAHRPKQGSRAWRTGSSTAWRKLRARVLARDGHQCVTCQTTEELEVHHLHPRSAGGHDTLDNLETRCARCHHVAHSSGDA